MTSNFVIQHDNIQLTVTRMMRPGSSIFINYRSTLEPSLSSTFTASIWSSSSPELTFSRGMITSLLIPSTSPSKFTLALPMLSSPSTSSVKHFMFRYSPPPISSNSNFWFQTGFGDWGTVFVLTVT